MSTVMYCYKVRREDWWEFAAKLRKFYHESNILLKVIHASAGKSVEDIQAARNKWLEWFRDRHFAEEYSSQVQLFELDDEHYLFRVLERGYRFMNNYEKRGWPVEPVVYDNRTDVPLKDEANEQTAEWMDERIQQRQYFLWPLVDKHDIFGWLWEWKGNVVQACDVQAAGKKVDDS